MIKCETCRVFYRLCTMETITFERIHNTKEQINFYERAAFIRRKSGCLNHSNERLFQVNIQMQGQIKDSWKGDL